MENPASATIKIWPTPSGVIEFTITTTPLDSKIHYVKANTDSEPVVIHSPAVISPLIPVPTTPTRLRSFDECYPEIAAIVEKKRIEWTFKASIMRDFDDIKNEILTHIWKKWHLFDQSRPLSGWAAVITKHQFTNILRDVYQSTASPCVRCACNMGDKACSLYTEQSVECPLFAKWYKGKRHAHNAKLPVTLENHLNEIYDAPENTFDLESSILSMHEKMKPVLTPEEWEIYQFLFIDCKTEEETAAIIALRPIKSKRKMTVKKVGKIKGAIVKKARLVVIKHGV